MKPKLIITTVGTSLIDKMGEQYPKGYINSNGQSMESPIYGGANQGANSIYKQIQQVFKTPCLEKAKKWLCQNSSIVVDPIIKCLSKNLDKNNELHRLIAPAEIASLWKIGANKCNEDKVVLLYTETPDGYYCYLVLKEYIEKSSLATCLKEDAHKGLLKGVRFLEGDDFEKEGIQKLVEIIKFYFDKYKANHELIINITGGYKGLIPYTSNIAMCYEGVDIYYLYEQANKITKMPVFPIDFDIIEKNEYRAIIKALDNIEVNKAKSLYESLPKKLRTLFIERDNKYFLSPIGKFLQDRFEVLKKGLSPYGSGKVALELLPENHPLKKDLERRISGAQFIWIGDNIPETVDHARGHCQRLVEMAVQLLKPVLDKQIDFLSPEEIYVLLYTLWIHDIGHSGRKTCYEWNTRKKEVDVSDFPSFVRDLHHELAFEMIEENPEYIGFNKEEIKENNKKTLFQAIRTAYRYHRNKAPMKNGDPKVEYHWKVIDEPAEKVAFLINGQPIKFELIVAIQRILDACDNQRERVINDEFRNRRIELTKREIEIEKGRLDRLGGILGHFIQNSYSNNDPLHFKKLKTWFENLWSIYKDFEVEKGIGKIRSNLNTYVNEIRNQIKDLKSIISKGTEIVVSHIKQDEIFGNDELTACKQITYREKEKLQEEIKAFEKTILKIVQLCWQREENGNDADKQYHRLLLEWLSCCDKILFKMIQEDHFEKHNKVNAVFIKLVMLPENQEEKNFYFSVVIELQEGKTLNEEETKHYVLKKIIEEDVKKEVLRCQNCLETDKGNIIFLGCEVYNYGKLSFDQMVAFVPFIDDEKIRVLFLKRHSSSEYEIIVEPKNVYLENITKNNIMKIINKFYPSINIKKNEKI